MVDPHVAFKLGNVGVHQTQRCEDAGVVHQAMQLANRLGQRHGLVPLRLTGDVQLLEEAGVAQFGSQALAFFHQHITDDDLAAFSHDLTRLRFAQAARTAGDKVHPVIESTHDDGSSWGLACRGAGIGLQRCRSTRRVETQYTVGKLMHGCRHSGRFPEAHDGAAERLQF